jgi:hypothetical protein
VRLSAPQVKTLVRFVEHIDLKNMEVKSRRLAGLNEKISHFFNWLLLLISFSFFTI